MLKIAMKICKFERGFWQSFDHKSVSAVRGIYLSFRKRKVNIPLFPSPKGNMVANDWFIKVA